MKTIEQELEELIKREGGYTNDPADPGGETNYGITVAVARKNGYSGDMKNLTVEQAKNIYRAEYWQKPGFESVYTVYQNLAMELFDTGVNMGVSTAGKFLQRALNALNDSATKYQDITVDGQIGPGTIGVLNKYKQIRGSEGEKVLLRLVDSMQAVRYVEIVEGKPTSERFMYGWVLNRVGT